MSGRTGEYDLNPKSTREDGLLVIAGCATAVFLSAKGARAALSVFRHFDLSMATFLHVGYALLIGVFVLVIVRGIHLCSFYLFADTIYIRGQEILAERRGKVLRRFTLSEGCRFRVVSPAEVVFVYGEKGYLCIPKRIFRDHGDSFVSDFKALHEAARLDATVHFDV